MRLFLIAVLALLSPTVTAARPAECLVTHNGNVVFSGGCDFKSTAGDGSFFVQDYYGRGAARVNVTQPKRGYGDVLVFPYGEPVILDSGRLYFSKGCWSNQDSEICAW